MKKILKPILYIVLGIIVAFPLFSLTYYTMVRTSTPQFCASCHEIEFAYNTWRTSTHICLQHLADLNPHQQQPGFRGGLHGLSSSRAAGHL